MVEGQAEARQTSFRFLLILRSVAFPPVPSLDFHTQGSTNGGDKEKDAGYEVG